MIHPKKYIFSFFILIAILLGAIYLKSILWYGLVQVSSTEGYSHLDINGKEVALLYPTQEIKLRPGKYRVSLSGPLKESISEEIKVGAFAKTTINVDPKLISEQELIASLSTEDLTNGAQVGKHKLLAGDTWLVAHFYYPNGTSEGYINLYHFTPQQGWDTVESGTGFDTQSLKNSGIHQDVISYLEKGV